ncbi:hypothetical protein, partial [Candidatus Ichthyocystis hellenicum]|uniref:hypothetical protein n=1 Tax=Candidatus Ichthyocystis hellenicum TaxID=1561003 RepID=UPI001112B933
MDNINTDGASNLGVCGASGGKDNDPDEESDGKRLLGGLSSLEESTNIPSRKCTPEHHPESSASNTGPLSRLARRVKSKFSRDRNPIPEKATFISYVDLYTIFDSKGQVHVTADNKEYLLKMLKEKSEKAYYDRIFEGMEGATLYNERYFEEILAKIRMEDKTAAAAAAAIESLQRLKVSV